MSDDQFFDDLASQLKESLPIETPQEEEEFTTRYFADKFLQGKYDTARRFLENEVKVGRLTVRRHVSLTWGRVTSGTVVADVYKLVNTRGRKNGHT